MNAMRHVWVRLVAQEGSLLLSDLRASLTFLRVS